jgi:DnaJ-domain-containing protein 1
MKKVCEFLNCKEEGIYPAPRSREDITNYKYYCIEHIRDFNKSWNFFEGLTDEQFENEIRKSTTWDRPSWKFGTSNYNKKINDPFNFLSDEKVSKKKFNYKLLSSWKLLELNPTADIEQVKKQYKSLAKKWHPDKNLKLKDSDMFVKITNAYKVIIKSFKSPSVDIS